MKKEDVDPGALKLAEQIKGTTHAASGDALLLLLVEALEAGVHEATGKAAYEIGMLAPDARARHLACIEGKIEQPDAVGAGTALAISRTISAVMETCRGLYEITIEKGPTEDLILSVLVLVQVARSAEQTIRQFDPAFTRPNLAGEIDAASAALRAEEVSMMAARATIARTPSEEMRGAVVGAVADLLRSKEALVLLRLVLGSMGETAPEEKDPEAS